MSNIEKYDNALCETFSIEKKDLVSLKYQSIHTWDSVGHLYLISTLEETFEIMIDTDDIIALNSYEKGKEILKKYGIEL